MLLLKNLRISVKDNSSAYAFSVMITGAYALLQTIEPAGPLDIAVAAFGAVAAFTLSELVALKLQREAPGDLNESTRLAGRMGSILSVGVGMGTAYLCGLFIGGWISWLAAGFVGSLLFVLAEGLELAVAEASETTRAAE